jgi:WD40 repeat protein
LIPFQRMHPVLAVVLITSCVAFNVARAESIAGPLLGFVRDSAGAAIRPVIGIPGAAGVADTLHFDVEIRDAVISPNQDYAMAVRGEDGSVVVINLKTDPPTLTPVNGSDAKPSVIAISPTGAVAAVYDAASRRVEVIGHLPQAPDVVQEFDLTEISGRVTGIAVSDDGSIAFVNFSDSLWLVSASGLRPVTLDSPASAAFFPNRHDAIVADDAMHEAYLMMDVDHGGARVPVPGLNELETLATRHQEKCREDSSKGADGVVDHDGTWLVSDHPVCAAEVASRNLLTSAATPPYEGGDYARPAHPHQFNHSSVAVSGNGQEVFIQGNSGKVAIVDTETLRSTVVDCDCRPGGLHRLKGDSIFQLTNATGEPMTVLDHSSGSPRIFIIPPAAQ